MQMYWRMKCLIVQAWSMSSPLILTLSQSQWKASPLEFGIQGWNGKISLRSYWMMHIRIKPKRNLLMSSALLKVGFIFNRWMFLSRPFTYPECRCTPILHYIGISNSALNKGDSLEYIHYSDINNMVGVGHNTGLMDAQWHQEFKPFQGIDFIYNESKW